MRLRASLSDRLLRRMTRATRASMGALTNRLTRPVGVQQQRPHGLFVEVFHHVAAEAALLRDALEQELIVVRNAQLAGKALADLAAAASILPADGENEMLVHAGPFRVPANSTRFR